MDFMRLTTIESIFHFPYPFLIFPVKEADEYGCQAEFNASGLAMQDSFSNFSFKVKPTTPRFF